MTRAPLRFQSDRVAAGLAEPVPMFDLFNGRNEWNAQCG